MSDPRTPDSTASLAPAVHGHAPDQIGRYRLLEALGQGGMGVVYRAHDEELDRDVAVKLLARIGDTHDARLHEAKTLAKLRHPNVVTVHDAGVDKGFVYVVMELVEGTSLRDWLDGKARTVREVTQVFAAAGRGLLAAHEAGLVHRDFKPANVLVARDGAVRVADFGLAFARGETLEGALAVAGTPRYMAPEQRRKADPDPRADQYSFCLSLHEALFAAHPADGPVPERSPARGRVPSSLRRTLQRGLEREPGRRWPDLKPLIAALERTASRRARLTMALAALVVASSSALAVTLLRRPDAGAACRGARARLTGVWDDGVKAATRRAFLATGLPYAEDSYTRVAASMDEFAGAWVAMRTDACEATAVRKEQSAELLDLRVACLDRRLGDLRALTALLAEGGRDVVERASSARLEPLTACADAAALRAAVPPPSGIEAQAQLATLIANLSEVKALYDVGRLQPAARIARRVAGLAAGLAYPPLRSEALLWLATITLNEARDIEALAVYYEAVAVSAEAHQDGRTAEAWMGVLRILINTKQLAEAKALRPQVEAAMARAGNNPVMRARYLVTIRRLLDPAEQRRTLEEARGLFERFGPLDSVYPVCLAQLSWQAKQDGHPEESLALAHRGRTLHEQTYGPRHPDVARSLVDEVRALRDLDRRAEAIELGRRAAKILEEAFGPDGSDVAMIYSRLGIDENRVGRPEEARAASSRAVAIYEHKPEPTRRLGANALINRANSALFLGRYDEMKDDLERAISVCEKSATPDDPPLSGALGNLAVAYRFLGRPDDAAAAGERGLALVIKRVGPDKPELADNLPQLGVARMAQGRYDEASELLGRALAVHEKTSPKGYDLLQDLLALCEVAVLAGRPAAARTHAERALAIAEATLPREHPYTGAALTFVAVCDLAEHQPQAALPRLERAVAILEERVPRSLEAGRAWMALAEALTATGGDGARARAAAAKARSVFAAQPKAFAAELRAADAWLARN